MATDREQLQAGIAALEAQRALLGDAVAEAALAPLRTKLATLPETHHPAPAQTLKQVTILFLDVVGSTTLSQHLDPEEIHAVMDGALVRCTAIVGSYRGKVLQYAGDSLLAVFGADEVREDDPERAVHAGLALLEEGRHQDDLVKRQHGREGLTFRVGLHTGSVLLGGGVDAEGSIRGIAVSVAARMEQTAPAGTLRISRDTYRHVRGLFEVEAQPTMSIKGLDEPFGTYLVLRAKPRAFQVAARGVEGVESRMIGRDAELQQLRETFKKLNQVGNLIAVTVVGEAGVGKSRLLHEFKNWIETQSQNLTVFHGRATPQMQSQPYGLLRDILAWRLQIADSDSMEVAKQKIEHRIVALFAASDDQDVAQAHAHLLGHLIGLDFSDSKHIQGIRDDGKQIRNRAFHAAVQMFRRIAVQDDAPIVLLLEDLHWADDGSLEFLADLTQNNRDVPMLILGLTRPTLFDRLPDWPGKPNGYRIELNPLDESASRLLANELLKKLPEIPAALERRITGDAQGNPFFMDELVNMLVDKGAIEVELERWTLRPDRLLAAHVPPTLTGVLQARLDQLPTDERLTLQEASVIGFVFWDHALAAVDTRAIGGLPGLVRRELIVPRQDASFEGTREYVFKHPILHHVTYDTLLKRERRECHAKVALWLARLTGTRCNEFLGATAEHFAKAGDAANACEYFARSAEHAAQRYAHETALKQVAQALSLLGGDEQSDKLLRWRLLDVRERTLDVLGKRTEQRSDVNALQGLAEAMDNDARRADAACRVSDFAHHTGDYRMQESAAKQAMALARRAGDWELELRAQQRLALALVLLGDLATGKRIALDGLDIARAHGLRLAESRFLNAMAGIASIEDDPMALLAATRQQLSIERELGNRRVEAMTLANLGVAWLELGEHIQAQRHFLEGTRLIRAVGDRAQEVISLFGLSELALRRGDNELSLLQAQLALDTATAVQDLRCQAFAWFMIGRAELALGHLEEGAMERAHAMALGTDNPLRYDSAACLASKALRRGDSAGALLIIEDLLAHLAKAGSFGGTPGLRFVRLTCYYVLNDAGDPRAADVIASAHATLQARAMSITDTELRKSFLDNIPEHREIVAAWVARQAGSAGLT